MTATVSATGSVQSASTATADFATAGTVTAIRVKVGDTVTRARSWPRSTRPTAQAQLDTAEANLTAAKASLTRARGAAATTPPSPPPRPRSRTAQAAVDAAAAGGRRHGAKAPMAGTVTAVNGAVGGVRPAASGSGGRRRPARSIVGVERRSSGLHPARRPDADAGRGELRRGRRDQAQGRPGRHGHLDRADRTRAPPARWPRIAPTATTANNVNSYACGLASTSCPTGVRIGQTVTAARDGRPRSTDALRVPTAAVRTAGNRHVVTVVGATADGDPRRSRSGVEGDSFTEITVRADRRASRW